eukprot:266016_1
MHYSLNLQLNISSIRSINISNIRGYIIAVNCSMFMQQFKNRKMHKRSLIIVADCCHSGGFINSILYDQKVKDLANSLKNLVIFASCNSFEKSRWKNSFTQ